MGKSRKVPLRKCTGCQQMKPKQELLRIVRTDENTVAVDITGRLNGRGAYLCRSISCFEKAVKTRALQRSLGTQISDETLSLIRETGGFETG